LFENYLNLTPAKKEAVTNEIGDYMGALEGKVAIVTGGNSGIGLATAKRFVEEGAYVFITARRQSELDKAVVEIGRNVTAIAGDLAKLEVIGKIAEIVKAEKGVIDIIVSNAGFTERSAIEEITPEHFANVTVHVVIIDVQLGFIPPFLDIFPKMSRL